jgi:hypothetical protein
LAKNGLGYILGDFSTSSSGHSESTEVRFDATELKLMISSAIIEIESMAGWVKKESILQNVRKSFAKFSHWFVSIFGI